jgi:hypothetical protein
MTPKSRLHIYPHREPGGNAYIVGERAALNHLAKALAKAAQGAVGLEKITSFTSDGHEYNIIITSEIEDAEWQTANPSYKDMQSSDHFSGVRMYNEYDASLKKSV